MDIIDVMITDLANAGFNRKFLMNQNAYFICTLYELWDVEDPEEQIENVKEFAEEYNVNMADLLAITITD